MKPKILTPIDVYVNVKMAFSESEGQDQGSQRRPQPKRSSKEKTAKRLQCPPSPFRTQHTGTTGDSTNFPQNPPNTRYKGKRLPQVCPGTRTPSDISTDFESMCDGENHWQESPPASPHSSQDDTMEDPSFYLELRTRNVAEYLQSMSLISDSRNPLVVPLPLRADKDKATQDKELLPQSSESNTEVTFADDSSNSSGISDTPTRTKFKQTIKDIVDDAINKEIELGDVVPFNYFLHQKALEARWLIVKAQRLERIATGNATLEHDVHIRPEWLDIEGELRRIYGPTATNKHSEVYQTYKSLFELQRLKLIIEMLEEENNLNGNINQTQHVYSSTSEYVKNLRLVQDQMGISLRSLYEANTDLNPYTNETKMDFFVYPRPFHSITNYIVLPERMERFIEFKPATQETCRLEGYNPAVFDIGCTYPTKIVGDHRRMKYFSGPKISRNLYKNWNARALHFKKLLNDYKFGIELSKFVCDARIKCGLFEDEEIFYKYSDTEGVYYMRDIFHPQELGPDKRLILFPGSLQNSINTPEEILKQTWNRIVFLLERNENIKLNSLVCTYEEFYAQKLYPLNWGFEGVEELCNYCIQLFPNELYDISVAVTNDQAKEAGKNCKDEKPEYNDGPPQDKGWNGILKNMKEWVEFKEPLPENYVFNIKAQEGFYFI